MYFWTMRTALPAPKATAQQNLRIQQTVTVVGVVLLVIKWIAWWLTGSVAILTDAMESIVNVVAGFIGMYSLYISAKPRDKEHPYGHGKAEFLSAAIEGLLISVAGVVICYEAIQNLIEPQPIGKLDYGIVLVAITAVVNYAMGAVCIRTGSQNKSLALVASGKHLQSDTYSTAGIIIGLILLFALGYAWIDAVVALIFAGLILYTGFKIIRSSVAGIMDEADMALLNQLVKTLNERRQDGWIDLHNVRIIKYGSTLHMDCHLTVPWFFNVHQAHDEMERLGNEVRETFGDAFELFVHADGCLPFSCKICPRQDCPERKFPFEQRVEWTLENLVDNSKHQLKEAAVEVP